VGAEKNIIKNRKIAKRDLLAKWNYSTSGAMRQTVHSRVLLSLGGTKPRPLPPQMF
jgi:hypothetical protein